MVFMIILSNESTSTSGTSTPSLGASILGIISQCVLAFFHQKYRSFLHSSTVAPVLGDPHVGDLDLGSLEPVLKARQNCFLVVIIALSLCVCYPSTVTSKLLSGFQDQVFI